MNVYVVEAARQLAANGTEVEIFTRATHRDLPPVVPLAPGVLVRNLSAGPLQGLGKEDLPSQLCAFSAGVLRTEASREPGFYDLVHSHYWLSGQVGWLAAERWGVPHVHTAHTWAKVKNAALAEGDAGEPRSRVIGEEQVVAAADRLLVSTHAEAAPARRALRSGSWAHRRGGTRGRPRRVPAGPPRLGASAPRAAPRRSRTAVRRAHPAAESAGHPDSGRR